MVFTSGWASGVNAYATVLLLGLLGRYAGLDGVPAGLERTDVLVAAAVMFVLEFVADKVPYLDSAWDAVHTVIRPTVGAAIGLLASGDAAEPRSRPCSRPPAGRPRLASHGVKAGRAAGGQHLAGAGLEHRRQPARGLLGRRGDRSAARRPWLAAGIAAVLLMFGLTLVVLLMSRIRRARARRRARRAEREHCRDAARHPGTGPGRVTKGVERRGWTRWSAGRDLPDVVATAVPTTPQRVRRLRRRLRQPAAAHGVPADRRPARRRGPAAGRAGAGLVAVVTGPGGRPSAGVRTPGAGDDVGQPVAGRRGPGRPASGWWPSRRRRARSEPEPDATTSCGRRCCPCRRGSAP